MKWSGNKGLAVLLIACGVLILLGKFGIGAGYLLSFLLPAAMVVLGVIGIRNGKSVIGWIVLTIGLIMLLGQLWKIAVFLAPVALIWLGWVLLKGNKTKEGPIA